MYVEGGKNGFLPVRLWFEGEGVQRKGGKGQGEKKGKRRKRRGIHPG